MLIIFRLSVNQYRHLCEMPVSNVMSISELFHEWVKIGFYDFCHLPYCLKVNLVTRQDILQRIETEGITLSVIMIILSNKLHVKCDGCS